MKKSSQRQSKNSEVSMVKKRRIGFDFPDNLIHEFKTATSLNGTTMTAQITEWMEDYCAKVKRVRGLDRLTK